MQTAFGLGAISDLPSIKWFSIYAALGEAGLTLPGTCLRGLA